jgi:DNA-binding transcriptional MerR regulator
MEYTISQVAGKMNLTPSTLRFYEKEGLLYPINRSKKGIRSFSDDDLEWISIL